jgi:hypothetical protein
MSFVPGRCPSDSQDPIESGREIRRTYRTRWTPAKLRGMSKLSMCKPTKQ